MTKEERISMNMIFDKMAIKSSHVRRLAPAIGPCIWKIGQMTGGIWDLRTARQLGFDYRGYYWKARYSHKHGGRLEVVQVLGQSEGAIVVAIANLTEAMTSNMQALMDNFIDARLAA